MKTLKTGFIFFSALLLFDCCTQKFGQEITPPEDLIPREKMVDVIVDLKLFDAAIVLEQKYKTSTINESKFYLYNSVIQKHGITRQQFESSLYYYQQDLDVMDKIFEEVITKLNKLKSQADQEE
jgi:hypothetical protein